MDPDRDDVDEQDRQVSEVSGMGDAPEPVAPDQAVAGASTGEAAPPDPRADASVDRRTGGADPFEGGRADEGRAGPEQAPLDPDPHRRKDDDGPHREAAGG